MTQTKRAYLMVVDDDASAREGLTRLLRCAGYVVCPASDGAEALAMLHAAGRLPDLVLASSEAPGIKSTFYRTLMRSHELSKIAYLAIGPGEKLTAPGTHARLEIHSLVQLIDRLVTPSIVPPPPDRRTLRA